MKRHLSYSLAVTSSLQRVLVMTPLLLGSALVSASPDTTPSAGLTPILALYQTADNNTEPACGLDLPAAGSNVTVKLFPKTMCPRVGDDPLKPHAIRIRNMPIKSTFLLTNNSRCEKANSAWIELETSRDNASLEKMGIDKLWTYAGSPAAPGYLNNAGLDSNVNSQGFKVFDKGNPIQPGELTCIVVTLADETESKSKNESK